MELSGDQSARDTSSNPFRFQSMYWDAHTQTYMTPNRHLCVRRGRWTQPDPFFHALHGNLQSCAFQAGNLFLFVMHNPIRFVDPTGLFAVLPSWLASGMGGGIVERAQAMLQSIRNSAPTEATTTHSPAITAPVSIQNIHFGVIAGGFDNKVRLRDGIGGPRKTQRVGGEGSRGGTPTTTKPPVAGEVRGFDGNPVPPAQLKGATTVVNNKGQRIDIRPSAEHSTTKASPIHGKANSSVDLLDYAGNIKIRRWFGQNGEHIRDVHFTHHGNPGKHQVWPHEGPVYRRP